MHRPPYSTGQAPSDFHLCGSLQKYLAAGKWFLADADVKQALTDTWHHFFNKIKALVPWWDKCLNVNDHDMKVWRVPSATYVPCIHWSQNKVSVSAFDALPLPSIFFHFLLVYFLKLFVSFCDAVLTADDICDWFKYECDNVQWFLKSSQSCI